MEDPSDTPNKMGKFELTRVSTSKQLSKRCSISSGPKSVGHQILKPITKLKHGKIGHGTAGQAASFLLKVAVLEVVRRLSRARCPIVWSGLQALQVFCYPPFKWIRSWNPFGFLVEGLQMLSQPLLVLSVATAFSDPVEGSDHVFHCSEDSQVVSDSSAVSESHPESSSVPYASDMRSVSEGSKTLSSSNWLVELHEELKNQGITLPERYHILEIRSDYPVFNHIIPRVLYFTAEDLHIKGHAVMHMTRINDEELYRFYTAANGEFSCLLSSVKKTIYWRNTYRILSGEELEMWSNMVFWHGFDVNHRPCLVVRLGLACLSLPSDERPRFAQAVVSQVEYGVLHLVDRQNPQITVLVDCEGLSPLRVPMQMMKSCSTLLQDHFPNRLGCLFIIRLPPVARVILQTFLRVLKPITRKKLKIEGNMYQMVLSECFLTLPSYLGGVCTCTGCVKLGMYSTQQSCPIYADETASSVDIYSAEDLPTPDIRSQVDIYMNANFDQVLRIAVVSILIFSVLLAFIAGIYDPESSPVLLA